MKDSGKFLYLDPLDAPSHMSRVDVESPVADPSPREALNILVCRLLEEDSNPLTQIAGYLIAEDPTYLPEDTETRALTRRIGRDRLLEALIESYLEAHKDEFPCP